jgi:hypothetical protein
MNNVKTFGAIGDGITDDTIAIQSAIDMTYLCGGGIVYLPEGTYYTTASIMLKSNIRILGAGIDLTIIDLKANNGVVAFQTEVPTLIALTQTTDLNTGSKANTINNSVQPGDLICFQSNDMFTSGWEVAIIRTYYTKGEIFEVDSATSTNITFTESAFLTLPLATTKGVESFTPTKNIEISDLTITRDGDTTSYGTGINIQYCNGVRIERIKAKKNNYAGIIISRSFDVSCKTIYAEGGTADLGLDYGIVVVDGSKRVFMQDIHIKNCRHGLAGGGSGYACPLYVKATGIYITNSFGASLDTHACCGFFTYENAVIDNGMQMSGIGHTARNIESSNGTPFAYDGGMDLTLDNVKFSSCLGWLTNRAIIGMTVRDSKFVITNTTTLTPTSFYGVSKNIKFFNTKLIHNGYNVASSLAQLDTMFRAPYAFILYDDWSLINCTIEGFPIAFYLNGSRCCVRDLTIRNCGWATTLGSYPCTLLVSKNGEYSTMDNIIIENINRGFSYCCYTIRFETLGTGTGKNITMSGVKHGRDNQVTPYYGILTTVGYSLLFFMDNQIVVGAGKNSLSGTGKFFNNSFVSNNHLRGSRK